MTPAEWAEMVGFYILVGIPLIVGLVGAACISAYALYASARWLWRHRPRHVEAQRPPVFYDWSLALGDDDWCDWDDIEWSAPPAPEPASATAEVIPLPVSRPERVAA